jgi:hypothetical protein
MTPGPDLPWKKRRELAFVEILFARLDQPATSIVATEDGADAIVMLSGKTAVSVQVTELYLTDDGQAPQARARRWYTLWNRLRGAIDPAPATGLLSIEFAMDGGWPAMPPSRDFPAIVEEVTEIFRGWDGQSPFVASPTPGSVLSRSVAYVHLEPSPISDISSNHQASFIPPVDDDSLARTIGRKVQGPRRRGTNWLLVVTGTDLHQPIGAPGSFEVDPDPDHVYERIFLYDELHQTVYEKAGARWVRHSTGSSEVQ